MVNLKKTNVKYAKQSSAGKTQEKDDEDDDSKPEENTFTGDRLWANNNFEEQEQPKWFESLPEEPEDYKPSTEEEINQLKDEAQTILMNDSLHYKNKCSQRSKNSNNEWLQTMMAKGTSKDKIAASVILFQNSPIHSLHLLRNLINLIKTSKKECGKTMEVLTDLFTTDLLIPSRPLRFFEKCPLSVLEKLSDGKGSQRKLILKLWYFEDQLKQEYANFVFAIKSIGQDSLENNKQKCIIAMQKLLVANEEQEALLLSTLVNKIGDPIPKIASKAVFHLQRVLNSPRNIKGRIIEEIQKVLFRTNIGKRAQYYAVCFLTQVLLNNEESHQACMLIDLYFSFFKACVKKGDVDSRMMSAILTGVNRAFPFAKKDELHIKEHIETLYKIVHIAHFNVSVQALCLLFQVCDYDAAISDRFYSVLYQKIVDPALSGSPQQAIFLSLIFRALSKDLQFNRVKTFIKRLLQICHYAPVPLVCAILVMISHLFKKNESLKSLTLFATKFEDENEGDEERYVDIKLEEEENKNSTDASFTPIEESDTKPIIPTWHHVTNLQRTQVNEDKIFNAYARNPLFVNGISVYTELVSLSTHYHPSVSLFASRLLEGAFVDYPGDPLRDFTLIRFLDRWVFKNPKKIDVTKESTFSRKRIILPSDAKLLSVTSTDYLNTPEKYIPSDELFLYRYLKKQESEGKLRNQDDDDVESVASDEFEGMMSQLMGGKERIDYKDIDYAGNISKVDESIHKKQKRKKGDDESLDSDDEMDVSKDMDSDSDEDGIEEGSDHSEAGELDDLDDESIGDDNDNEDFDDDNEVLQFDSDGEEDFEFTMSDVERDEEEANLKKKGKKSSSVKGKTNNKKKEKGKGIDSSVFAPAEEFAEMLEDTGEQIAKYGQLTTLSNADNAGMKQLKWEMSRDQWLNRKSHKRKKSGQSKQPLKKWKKRH